MADMHVTEEVHFLEKMQQKWIDQLHIWQDFWQNIVANKLAKKCEIQLSYAIGIAKPISIYVNTFGTNSIPEEEISQKIYNEFDLTPRGIINYLNLQQPIYKKTTNYGHFGKEYLPWEKIVKFGE